MMIRIILDVVLIILAIVNVITMLDIHKNAKNCYPIAGSIYIDATTHRGVVAVNYDTLESYKDYEFVSLNVIRGDAPIDSNPSRA